MPDPPKPHSYNVQIDSPSGRLPPAAKLPIVGLAIGLALLVAGDLTQNDTASLFVPKLMEQLGEAVLIATVVGLGVDRLFHVEHLTALTRSMSGALTAAFDQSNNQIEALIPATLRKSAAGRRMELLDSDPEIYRELNYCLEKYPHYTNTIMGISPTVISQERAGYYKLKTDLMNAGRLTCRELVSEDSKPIIDGVFRNLLPEKRSQLDVRMVDLNATLPSVVNFCIFQRDLTEYEDAVLMLGWFSKSRFGRRHSTVITDHPGLVRMFSDYFEMLTESARDYAPPQ